MDVSREFFCPKCRTSLTMSDSMHMLALVHRSGGNYIANVTVETVTCPGCGHAIGVRDIIEGKHSAHGGTADAILSGIGCLAVIAGGVYLVSSCS